MPLVGQRWPAGQNYDGPPVAATCEPLKVPPVGHRRPTSRMPPVGQRWPAGQNYDGPPVAATGGPPEALLVGQQWPTGV